MKNEAAVSVVPKWEAAVLVCRDCGKRSRAPKDAKPKKLASALKRLTKRDTVRSRIVLTSCLGLCPKGATAVAFIASDRSPRLVAIEREDQLGSWTAVTPPDA